MNKKWIRSIIGILLAGAGIFLTGQLVTRAFFSEDNAVHIKPMEIEDSTLIIGTHLIHISALTDSIYNVAKDSAAESGQDAIYYKSELAGGIWMDITEASVLFDIGTGGKPADTNEIAQLWMTYHTKSDQVTYDLLTGKAVNLFDILNPYDLNGLTELDELKLQEEQMGQRDDLSDQDQGALAMLKKFFKMNLEDDETARWDKILQALQLYKDYLTKREETQLLNLLNNIMEGADATRRAIIYEKLSNGVLDDLLNDLQATGNEALLSSVSNSLMSVQEKGQEYEAGGFTTGSGIIGELKYNLTQELFLYITTTDFTTCDTIMWQLYYIDNIENSIIGKKEEELAFIRSKLIPPAEAAFKAAVNSGASGDYNTLAAAPDAVKGVLQETLKSQKNDSTMIRMELQLIIQAAYDRMEQEVKVPFTDQKLAGIAGYEENTVADAFREYALAVIHDYEDWLQELKKAAGGSGAATDRERVEAQKEEYLALKAAALDNNDLAKAADYDVLLEALDETIEQLGGGIQESLKDAGRRIIILIDRGEFDEAMVELEGVTAFIDTNRLAVVEVLKEVYQHLNALLYLTDAGDDKHGSYINMIEWIEEFIAEHAGVLEGALQAEDIIDFFNDYFGGSIYQANEDMQAAALIAIHLYGEHTQNNDIKSLAAAMAEQFKRAGNPYIFKKYNGITEYLPTKTIGACLGYRYVFNNSEKKVTLSQKGRYYYFYDGSLRVDKKEDSYDEMKYEARYQATLYIEEDYAYQAFGAQAIYLKKADQGILATDEIMDQAEELFQLMIGKGSDN